MSNYWDSILTRRVVSRRKALAIAGGGAGTALQAACGGDDEGGSGDGSASPSAGSTQSAGTPKQGGHYGYYSLDVPNNNPVVSFSLGNLLDGVHVYDRLLTIRGGKQAGS